MLPPALYQSLVLRHSRVTYSSMPLPEEQSPNNSGIYNKACRSPVRFGTKKTTADSLAKLISVVNRLLISQDQRISGSGLPLLLQLSHIRDQGIDLCR